MSKLTERMKALGQAIAGIEKQFGKGSIMRLGDGAEPAPVSVVPTGSLSLDLALGVGGLPRGRIVFSPRTIAPLYRLAEALSRVAMLLSVLTGYGATSGAQECSKVQNAPFDVQYSPR